jgi:hypothetical protein
MEGKQKLFDYAMSSDDPVLVNLLSKYIFPCFLERDKSLTFMED